MAKSKRHMDVPKERVSEGPPTQPPPKLENVHHYHLGTN